MQFLFNAIYAPRNVTLISFTDAPTLILYKYSIFFEKYKHVKVDTLE